MTAPKKPPIIDTFVLMILGIAVLASVFPATGEYAAALSWATKIGIAALFFLYGARLEPHEVVEGIKHWRLHGVTLAATYVLFPVLGLVAAVTSPALIPAALYTGFLYLTLVPSTVQSSIVFTSIARGNVPGAVVSASISNILGVFVTPLLVIALMNTTGKASVDGKGILDVVVQLLLPFVLGQLLRPWVKDAVARFSKRTKAVDRGSILLVVYSAFSESMREGIWHVLSIQGIVAIVVLCCVLLAVVLGITWSVGKALGFARADRIVVLFCGSKKSLASGLPMASVLFAGQPIGLVVLPLMIFHQIQLIVCAMLSQRMAHANAEV